MRAVILKFTSWPDGKEFRSLLLPVKEKDEHLELRPFVSVIELQLTAAFVYLMVLRARTTSKNIRNLEVTMFF